MAKLYIEKNYGTIPNHILNDPNLSLKAKGLWGYLQSKPDGWKFSISRIATQTKDGRESIRSAIKELEKAGYLRRVPVKDIAGKWTGFDYILSENPFTENPSTVFPSTGNLFTLSKKENSKKDIVKKKKDFKKVSSGKPDDRPFSFKENLEKLLNCKQRHIRIIGLYFKHKGFVFDNKEQFQSAVSRNLRPARRLVGYSDEDILRTFEWLDEEEYLEKWTLETVEKYIDEVRKIRLEVQKELQRSQDEQEKL